MSASNSENASQTESDEEHLERIQQFSKPLRTRGGGQISDKDDKNEENYDDEPDETIGERLLGLTEMFPQPVRDLTGLLVDGAIIGIKGLYKFTCNASWIFFTTSVILFAPVVFETERAQMEEMQKTQQKQVLLGPGTAMSAVGAAPELPLIR